MASTPDFDLELHTLWFTRTPPKFPVPSMLAHGPCTSTYTWSMEQSYTGTVKILICAVLFTDTQAITKIRITFDPAKPSSDVKADQKHYPPPMEPTVEDLAKASTLYGTNIAHWCEQTIGTTVGDGECWTLIHTALQDLAAAYTVAKLDPPLISQGHSHGHKILSFSSPTMGSNSGLLQLADVRRGDILELASAHFHSEEENPDSGDMPRFKPGEMVSEIKRGPRTKDIRLGHHSAVIVGVEGNVVTVVEQNGSVEGGVAQERYDLCGEGMVKGKVEVWRVVGQGQGQGLELNAEWED